MHRRFLNHLWPVERAQLANLIQQYATPDILAHHANAVFHLAHQQGRPFLEFHRNYIQGLENFLWQRGFYQFVPLPYWSPTDGIPFEFNIPNTGPDALENLTPMINFFPQFARENLRNFPTVEALGNALIQPHNDVHIAVGGVMNNVTRSPEAPIFWPWHAFIDDIWWEWERCR